MSHTDTPAPRTSTHPLSRLMTLTALLTLVLTTALPLGEALTTLTTLTTTPTTHATPTTPTTTSSPATASQTTPRTPTSPRPSRADRAAAHHDGCRQQTSTATGTLISRPSCRSGMPVTHDRGLAQVPPQVHDDQGPVAPNEVPPAWSGHWRQAAHSPYHRSQA